MDTVDEARMLLQRGESSEALRILETLSNFGDVEAQLSLGDIYLGKRGVPQDYPKSFKWFRAAAEMDDGTGQYQLGLMYFRGMGVPQDATQASIWFHLGFRSGHPDAERLRDEAIKQLTSEQRAQANRMCKTFIRPLKASWTNETPRQLIAAHDQSSRDLPISGGWGYCKEDACIIDKDDPNVSRVLPFDGGAVERVFVENRTYAEMISFRAEGDDFAGIKWNMTKQWFFVEGGRKFDKLKYEVTAFPQADWQELRTEYEGTDGHGTPGFDAKKHERKRQEKMIRLERTFWFDITSFYGSC